MERAALPLSSPPTDAFVDGLGERRQVVDPTGNETIELLCLRNELAAVPSFEFALRERVSRLANFRHSSYGRVRSVDRLADRETALAVVSDYTEGVRLSDMLVNAEERRLGLDINIALCLIRQLVPAVAMLHENARDAAHGAIGPERLIVTSDARLVIVEYVLGAALEQLHFSQERYWHQLRIPLPKAAGVPRFDQRADVTQIGVVALSLILGRSLRDDEYPSRIGDVVASTWAVSARGGFEPLPPGLRAWLGRTLQLDPRNAFESAIDAQMELDKVLGEGDDLTSPTSLESFLTRYHAAGAASEAPAAPPRFAAPVRPAVPSTPAFSIRPTPTPAWEPTSLEILAPPSAPRAQSPPTTMAPSSPLGEIELQPLADSVTVRTPPRGIPTAQLRKPAPIEPTPYEASPSIDMFAEEATTKRRWPKLVAIAAILIAIVGAGSVATRRYLDASKASATGTLVLATNPPGALATVDGQPRGTTPLTLVLPVGPHTVVLRSASADRSIPVTISAGAEVSQYIELPQAGSTLGQLQVRTEPAGAKVTIDGVAVGTSPMMVIDLAPGEHAVTLESPLGSVKQTVTIESGMTASLVVPLGGASEGAPVSGWISVQSPIELQVYEGDRLLGSSRSDRIVMSAGRHEINIVNESLGYRASRVLQVAGGKVSPFAVELPKGTIALNAVPWAEVWIDGVKVGDTPIGNLSLAIGNHDVVFRHPELGEQRHTATVTLATAARLSVDLRKQ
jgi:serine/threonine protein kinase